MKRIRKLASFLLATFMILANLSSALASNYDDSYEVNNSKQEDQLLGNFTTFRAPANKDVIPITSQDQPAPSGNYCIVRFKNGWDEKIRLKREIAYYVNKDAGIKIGDPRIVKPDPEDIVTDVGYQFANWSEPDYRVIKYDTDISPESKELPEVIDNTKGDKKRPRGYVEVKFIQGKNGTINGKTLYVNSTVDTSIGETSVTPDPGYEFAGWSKNIEPYRRYSKDITVTAKFNEIGSVIEHDLRYGDTDYRKSGRVPKNFVKITFTPVNGCILRNYRQRIFYVDPDKVVALPTSQVACNVGYEFAGWTKNFKSLKQYKEDMEIKPVLNKLPNIIPKIDTDGYTIKPSGYVKIKFKSDGRAHVEGDLEYWVNPTAGVYLKDLPLPAIRVDKGYTFNRYYPSLDYENPITSDRVYVATEHSDPSSPGQYIPGGNPLPRFKFPTILDEEEEDEPGFGKTFFNVKVRLHPLKDKIAFDFAKIYPSGANINVDGEYSVNYKDLENGEEVIKHGEDQYSNSKDFSPTNLSLNFGIVSQLYFADEDDFLPGHEKDDAYMEAYVDPSSTKVLEDYGSKVITWDGGYPTTTLPVDIYQVQNTEVIFKTQDKDGNILQTNPKGKFTYRLGEESKSGEDIPSDSSNKDMIEYLDPHVGNWKDNYDGTKTPIVSLDNPTNGFIVDGDFAYKIIKQEQKDNDKSNPLEVTLIKKPLVVTTDPKDSDYVKVDFNKGDHGSMDPNSKVYWVLKGIDLGNRVIAPNITPDFGWKFTGWDNNFKTEGQIYNNDTIHTAQYENNLSDKDIIPYIPDNKTNPADPNDPGIPKKDEDGKDIDKSKYDIVAFKTEDPEKGTLSHGTKENQEYISVLVKKDLDPSKRTFGKVKPQVNELAGNKFWYWDKNGDLKTAIADSAEIKNGEIYTAHFAKHGDTIRPNTPDFPESSNLVKVTYVAGEGVSFAPNNDQKIVAVEKGTKEEKLPGKPDAKAKLILYKDPITWSPVPPIDKDAGIQQNTTVTASAAKNVPTGLMLEDTGNGPLKILLAIVLAGLAIYRIRKKTQVDYE